jgi:hypothetical protein
MANPAAFSSAPATRGCVRRVSAAGWIGSQMLGSLSEAGDAARGIWLWLGRHGPVGVHDERPFVHLSKGRALM